MYQEVFKLHSDLLKALSHPKRLEIIHLLREQELTVTEIKNMLGLPQANLSQHLQVLRQAGVVQNKKKGKEIFYWLSHKNFIRASDLLRRVLVLRYKGSPLADEFTLKMSDLMPVLQDPVCGMRLSPKTAAYVYKHKGKTYYFCAQGCDKKFKENPLRFVKE